jgi:hypothetical protein
LYCTTRLRVQEYYYYYYYYYYYLVSVRTVYLCAFVLSKKKNDYSPPSFKLNGVLSPRRSVCTAR